jgi:xylulokinase
MSDNRKPVKNPVQATRDGPLLVGLDVGTSTVKAVVVDVHGQTVAIASRPQATDYPRPGWASHDPAAVWDICCTVLREAIAGVKQPDRIAAVAVASMGEAGVTLDRAGQPTGPIIAWFDRRTVAQTDRFAAAIDDDALFAITGTVLQPIMTAPKLMWLAETEPDMWQRTDRFLNVSAWIAHKLGAEPAQDYSLASRTGLFDLESRTWSQRLLDISGLDASLFGQLAPGGTPIGEVSAKAAARTGLPQNTVIGLAGHDHLCGAFAGGVIRRGDLLDSIGTAEGLLVGLDEPVRNVAMGQSGYTQGAHVVPDQYYGLGAVYTAGGSIEWARTAIGQSRSHGELLTEAAAVPAGSLGVMFLPHLRLAMFPQLDSRARGAFVGLTTDSTLGAMFRAVLEGIAFEGRAGFGPLSRFAQVDPVEGIKVIGGTARNRLLIEIKASVMNAPQHVLNIDEATALGAAMLGGMAAGVYRDADDAIAQIRYESTDMLPGSQDDIELYNVMFERIYRHLYDALRPMHHRLHDLFMIDPASRQ